ncbi:PREDICTED: E3 ubiquitin-protein ligase TRIM11-like [Nanorana parkeri]|uniref:E3 ubiquitin-protein ligase TRIM11-like n=1 Tax=Nanorana parkeri TaxID=125878 RepID=UPI0008543D8B|nr:PREDICTED: E3 ubiquitin-protein ligase TRIM11-like [Nanorana parkeri]
MASADLSSELRCSVCIDIYDDPATLPCGHSFCRNCITQAWDHQGKGDSKCPECKQIYKKRPELKTNLRLLNIAKAFLQTLSAPEGSGIYCTYCDSPVPAAKSCVQCETAMCDDHLRKHNRAVQHALIPPTGSVRDRKCSVHQEILDHYCAQDAACICASCRLDGEHGGHQVETLDEASEKKKEKLRHVLETMTARREEAEEKVRSLREHGREAQERAAEATERVAAMFRDIRRQLEDLEKKVRSEISGDEEKISRSVSKMIRQLETKTAELSRKMRHVEEMVNAADPLIVLQDHNSDRGDFSQDRDDTKMEAVGHMTFSDTLHSGLSDLLRCANILFYTQDPSDLTLDQNTAANNLKVLPTLRTVRWSHVDQNHPPTPERFEKYQVISGRSFSSGRHYWDVETSRSGGWGIGVCYPSVERRGDQSILGENGGSWCLRRLCLWRWYQQYSARHDGHMTQLPHHVASDKFRIFLDYEAGQVSFYELGDPVRHLHTFTAKFTEPLRAAFYVWGDWWYKDSWVRIKSHAQSLSWDPDWVNSRSIGSTNSE